MNIDLKAKLLDLKARQEAGEHMMCPRCGKDTMKPELHTNAMSRQVDLYVCDACGTNEAMLAFMHNPLPLTRWACFQPERPLSDLEALSREEATKLIREQRIPYLCTLFSRWLDDREDADFEAYQREAFEKCPGLQELWPDPFRAVFATRTHLIHVRFKRIKNEVLVATDWVKR